MGRTTILIVDDDSSIVMALSRMLRADGYDVVSAYDAESGWSVYKTAKPDLVLTDLRMPGTGGLHLISMIREEDPKTTVIVITGHGSVETAIEAMRLGADDFIVKPFSTDELRRRIETYIGEGHLEREIARLKGLASALAKQNNNLKEQIESLSGNQEGGVAGGYQAIWGAAAHNLKGELLHIGNSVRAVRELADVSTEIHEECDLIERSVEYSQLLLRRLLDFIDMGKPRVESISIRELLRRMESLARPRLPSSVRFQTRVSPNIKGQIVCTDIEQLMAVLLELVNNAANVLRERGGTIEVKIGEMKGELAISVKDDGPGIPKELRMLLFKEQVSSKSGLGLGLFLSNKVVTVLGGKLSLQASSKNGTTFMILLPITSDRKVS